MEKNVQICSYIEYHFSSQQAVSFHFTTSLLYKQLSSTVKVLSLSVNKQFHQLNVTIIHTKCFIASFDSNLIQSIPAGSAAYFDRPRPCSSSSARIDLQPASQPASSSHITNTPRPLPSAQPHPSHQHSHLPLPTAIATPFLQLTLLIAVREAACMRVK